MNHFFNQKRVLREWKFGFEYNSIERSPAERSSTECNSIK